MLYFAIDPGTRQSAFVVYDTIKEKPIEFGIYDNHDMIGILRTTHYHTLVIEMIASYGMPVGKEVFETCVWIGRFIAAYPGTEIHRLIYRKDIKMHFCGSMRAKDSNIRQALIDRFGGSKQIAVGIKKQPGPLYGFKKDMWAALAVALYAADNQE